MRSWLLCFLGAVGVTGISVDGYDESVALRFTKFARASFCDLRVLKTWSCGSICEESPVVPGSVRILGPGPVYGVHGFVAELPPAGSSTARQCIVVFRGTASWENTFADAEFTQKLWGGAAGKKAPWCKDCLVHRGFAEAYTELRSELLVAIRDLACDSAAVTGHSLGAAMATLAALDLRAGSQLPVHPVFTFGSPRVGNKAFKRAFEAAAGAQHLPEASWRVVHYHDPVPRIPPGLPPLDIYEHVAHEVYYTTRSSSEFKVCNGSGEDPSCGDSVPLIECVSNDHLHYLNVSFNHRSLPPQCYNRTESPDVQTELNRLVV